MSINVVNVRTHKPTDRDVYIGGGSALGNPFPLSDRNDSRKRNTCISRYEGWLKTQIKVGNPAVIKQLKVIADLAAGGDVNLVCYCAPLNCHGNIIKKTIEKYLKAACLSIN